MRRMSGLLLTAAITVVFVIAARRAGLLPHTQAKQSFPAVPKLPSGSPGSPALAHSEHPHAAAQLPDTRTEHQRGGQDARPPKTVCVAAIQCASQMGKVWNNRERLTELIKSAAAGGARIVVLPECALQGYMDPVGDVQWSKLDDGVEAPESERSVKEIAQRVPGPATREFGKLCRDLKIYLALPMIEADSKREQTYYNALVLLGPDGNIVARHRKHSLWAPGDGNWVTESRDEAQVVETPFGRLGLMICHDVHVLPAQLKAARADIVLYSVGWYGPNTENWFREIFPRRYSVPNHFAVVAANWCSPAPPKGVSSGETGWQGQGFSCIIERDGQIMAMAGESNQAVVSAELQINDGSQK